MSTGLGRNYDIQKVVMSYKGVWITEFAEGDAIVCESLGQDFVGTGGSHNAAVRSRTPNPLWGVKFMLLQGSPAVGILRKLHAQDVQTGLGSGVLDINDLYGSGVFNSIQAYFTKQPPLKFAFTVSAVEFEMEAVNPVVDSNESVIIS